VENIVKVDATIAIEVQNEIRENTVKECKGTYHQKTQTTFQESSAQGFLS
jgi:hypothetical protein